MLLLALASIICVAITIGLLLLVFVVMTRFTITAPAYFFAVLFAFTKYGLSFFQQVILCAALCFVIYLLNRHKQTAVPLTILGAELMGYGVSLFCYSVLSMACKLPFGKDSFLLMIPALVLAFLAYAFQIASDREYEPVSFPVVTTIISGLLYGLCGAAVIALGFTLPETLSLIIQIIVMLVIAAIYCSLRLVSDATHAD